MATFFSANQYEDAFWSDRISRWELPHPYKERPDAQHGYTRINSNDRGHLLDIPEVRRSTKNPWGNFVGTWDLPKKLPGPRVFVKTPRRFDPHDKLVREYYRLEPHINGMAKNGLRNLRHEDAGGRRAKKPIKLGSVSPAHKESCKDLELFTSRSPQTPPLDPAVDDYHDNTCPGKTCLEEAEELARGSPASGQGSAAGGGRRSGGGSGSGTPTSGRSPMTQCPAPKRTSPRPAPQTGCGLDQPVVDRRAPSPKFSNKKALCDPIPPNVFDDVTKPASPMKIPSPDRADAPALVFADDELCVERQPMKTHVRGQVDLASPKSPMSPVNAAAAARRARDRCRFSPAEPPAQRELRPECKRFAVPHCTRAEIECAPLYDEFTEQPPTETVEGYLTKPMRLPDLPVSLNEVYHEKNTLFAI